MSSKYSEADYGKKQHFTVQSLKDLWVKGEGFLSQR